MDDDAPNFADHHFFAVPNEWLPHLGRLAVLSSRIETSTYNVAELLGLPRPRNGRTPGFRKECDDIRARLDDPWFPRVIDDALPGWRSAMSEWTKRAPGVLDSTRNLYLHASYAQQMTSQGLVPVRLNRLDVAASTEVTLQDVVTAVVKLVPIEKEGMDLWVRLVMYIQDLRNSAAGAS